MSTSLDFDPARQAVRQRRDRLFEWVCFGAASLGILLLGVLLLAISVRAWG